MSRKSGSSSSGGGFVSSVSVASVTSLSTGSGEPRRRRGRLAVDDSPADGPVTVKVIDRDEIPRMTGKGRFRIG